jgi:hypothetical protein
VQVSILVALDKRTWLEGRQSLQTAYAMADTNTVFESCYPHRSCRAAKHSAPSPNRARRELTQRDLRDPLSYPKSAVCVPDFDPGFRFSESEEDESVRQSILPVVLRPGDVPSAQRGVDVSGVQRVRGLPSRC